MAEWSTVGSSALTESWRFDSEYWRAEYLDNLKTIRRVSSGGLSCRRIKNLVASVTGSAFYPSFVGYYSKNGLPFIRVADLGDLFLKDDGLVRISAAVIRAHRQVSSILPGDLVIAKGGSIGGVCVLTGNFGESAVCRDVVAVRTDSALIDPYYLAVFLNTRYGRLQLERNKSQQVQAHLTFRAVEQLEVAYPNEGTQRLIRGIAISSLSALQEGKRNYADAQELLESELGLGSLEFHKPVGYTARFSELAVTGRADAQHYQPRYTQLLDNLSALPLFRIRDIRTYNRRGIQPVYVDGGEIAVVNSRHLGARHIDYDGLEQTSATVFANSTEAHIHENDLLIYTTGAYIGRTNVYLQDVPALASNHVNILRLAPGIDAAYLGLVLQSIVGQFQTQKHARGSAQAELYPTDIDRFVVPIIDYDTQVDIGNLLRKSLAKQRCSKMLLEEAKTRVEQIIEAAVKL